MTSYFSVHLEIYLIFCYAIKEYAILQLFKKAHNDNYIKSYFNEA